MSEYRFATQQNISIPYTTTEIAEEIFGIKAYKPSDLLNALHLKINSLGIIVQITRRMPKSELGRIKPSIINFYTISCRFSRIKTEGNTNCYSCST